MATTGIVDWLEQPVEGFMVNAGFSNDNGDVIVDLMNKIKQRFGDKVFIMPKQSLHITLLDWIAPLVDYGGEDKKQLFQSVQAEYDTVLSRVVGEVAPITVRFNEIKVYPTTIILLGHDDGQFQTIRDNFVNNVTLIPNTKLPPKIIHSSIVRFMGEIPLEEVEAFVASLQIDIVQELQDFRLVNSTKEPMLEYTVLKNYHLGTNKKG